MRPDDTELASGEKSPATFFDLIADAQQEADNAKLRDRFAVAALGGMLANPQYFEWQVIDIAAYAYRCADAAMRSRGV